MIEKFYLLIIAHAFGDGVFQTAWIGKYKSRLVEWRDSQDTVIKYGWFYVLSLHSIVNGAMVYLVTQNMYLGIAETILHWLIDYGSSNKKYPLSVDQTLHIVCKIGYLPFL